MQDDSSQSTNVQSFVFVVSFFRCDAYLVASDSASRTLAADFTFEAAMHWILHIVILL